MGLTIKNLPAHERPREKLIAKGVENLTDKELLAILLRTGQKGKSAIDIADSILTKYPKKEILNVSFADLKKMNGIGADKACTLLAALEFTKRALEMQKGG
jgi:DNA repair protein RadC